MTLDNEEKIIALLTEILEGQRELHRDIAAMRSRLNETHWFVDDMHEELLALHETLRSVEKRLAEPPRLNIFPN
jgi:hypothetical protein